MESTCYNHICNIIKLTMNYRENYSLESQCDDYLLEWQSIRMIGVGEENEHF